MLKAKCASIHSNNDHSVFVNGVGLSMTHTSRAKKSFHDYSIDVITDSFSKHTRQLSKPDNISEVSIVKHSACLGEYRLLPQRKCHDKAIKCVRQHQVFQSYVSFFIQARNAVAVFLVLSLPSISFLSLQSSTCGLS